LDFAQNLYAMRYLQYLELGFLWLTARESPIIPAGPNTPPTLRRVPGPRLPAVDPPGEVHPEAARCGLGNARHGGSLSPKSEPEVDVYRKRSSRPTMAAN